MRSNFTRAVTLAAVSTLGACASLPQQPFNHAANPQIRTIGLLSPDISPELAVHVAVGAGASFGLIGGLIDAGVESSKTGDFNEAMKQKGLNMPGTLYADVARALAANGYRVKPVAVARGDGGLLESYPPADGSVEAYLDLSSSIIGYESAGATTPYRPTIGLTCKLVSARDGTLLMQDTIAYNPFGNSNTAVTIPPDTKFEFPGFSDIMADPDKAAAGLKVASVATAQAVGQLLK